MGRGAAPCVEFCSPPSSLAILRKVAESQTRANMYQLTLDRIEALPEETARAVLQKIPESTQSTIRAASRVEWLPTVFQAQINAALLDVLGADDYRSFWAETSAAAFESSVFGGFAKTTMRLMGLNPGTLMKAMPRSHSLVTRHGHTVDVNTDNANSRATVTFEAVPACFRDSRGWILSQAASIDFLDTLVPFDSEVTIHDEAFESHGKVILEVTWQPRK